MIPQNESTLKNLNFCLDKGVHFRMRVLGLNISGYISSAALVIDGNVVAGCCEERFTRKKRDRSFPIRSIKYCLEKGGIVAEDLDAITVGWNSGRHLELSAGAMQESNRMRGKYLFYVPNEIFSSLVLGECSSVVQEFQVRAGKLRIVYLDHHKAHMASSYYLSGFEDAAILSADAFGEKHSMVFAVGQGKDIETLKEIAFPYSLGSLYSTITSYLGFRKDLDEWKVMALASYGKKGAVRDFEKLYSLCPDGIFRLMMEYFRFQEFDDSPMWTPKLENLLGPCRKPGEQLTQRHYDIAGALQDATESILFHALRWLRKTTNIPHLCVAGGCFMNSVFNGKLVHSSLFDAIYIPPFPDDAGISVGSALWYDRKRVGRQTAYFNGLCGPEFSDGVIALELRKRGWEFRKVECPASMAAELISAGLVVCWFQGRAEMGQRALGNRSILADPRDAKIKDRLNIAIKSREPFRPFGASVLEEEKTRYFYINAKESSPFMERVFQVRQEYVKKLPAIVHFDGSCRVQTVGHQDNSLYWKLLKFLGERTGMSVVLNTSFNTADVPIVHTPSDALSVFQKCDADAILIGRCLICRKLRKPL